MDTEECEATPNPENDSPDPDAVREEEAAAAPQPSWFSFKGLLLWLALGGLIFATLCILERFKEAFLFGA